MGSDPIGGWLLGHLLRKGHKEFPGDPIPDGSLGSAADLAFWGGVLDDDDEDSDLDDFGGLRDRDDDL